MESSISRNKPKIIFAFGFIAFVYLLRGGGTNQNSQAPRGGVENTIEAATWNIAAINNNPFEYWTTLENEDYNMMMNNLESYITKASTNEPLVNEVFTVEMADELFLEMGKTNFDTNQVEQVKAIWKNDLSKLKTVSGFLKDSSIGSKRLVSMPDRVSNTINLADGNIIYRPSVINCYSGDFRDLSDWWKKWKSFMFHDEVTLPKKEKAVTVISTLIPISKAKYPKITDEEAAISLPLQTLYLAVFDAVVVDMMNHIALRQWQPVRHYLCQELNLQKNDRLVDIIRTEYKDLDVLFLQEVAVSFIEKLKSDETVSELFHVAVPHTLGKRNQNSIMLLKKASWDWGSQVELTSRVVFEDDIPVGVGDVFALGITFRGGNEFVLASFHGDTNGLATIPVVTAVSQMVTEVGGERGKRPVMLFGLDANTYAKGHQGKTQDVTRFAAFYTSIGIDSCWGAHPDPGNPTTHNARTFLQPQLNKGATRSQIKEKGDHNPKDFMLFFQGDLVPSKPIKDNSGSRTFDEELVFPTPEFPSDHAVLSTTFTIATENLRG